jgi:hypothetical protein
MITSIPNGAMLILLPHHCNLNYPILIAMDINYTNKYTHGSWAFIIKLLHNDAGSSFENAVRGWKR